jgi:hypothetical protein
VTSYLLLLPRGLKRANRHHCASTWDRDLSLYFFLDFCCYGGGGFAFDDADQKMIDCSSELMKPVPPSRWATATRTTTAGSGRRT